MGVDAAPSPGTGTSLNASRLICRDGSPSAQGPAGYQRLLQHGYVVELAPGLASGLPLFQRTVARLADRCCAALHAHGAQELCLPASEGGALINLLLHSGAAMRSDRVAGYVVGAGFRHDGPPPRGLYDMPLYQRFDAAVVAGSDESPGEWMSAMVDDLLASIELPLSRQVVSDEETDLLVQVTGEESSGEIVGRIRGAVLEGTGRELSLVSLDLCALLGAVADIHGDDAGLAWPACLAPFDVGLLAVDGNSAAACGLVEKLRVDLLAEGLDVLVDERPLDAATRRAALTAWGLPLRVLAGPTADQGEVLLERRKQPGPPQRVQGGELVAQVRRALGQSVGPSPRALRRRANH